MGKYYSYSDYANPGTDWLGEIPSHWKTKRLGVLFSRKKETGFTDEELLSVYRDYGVIPKASREDNFNKPSDDLSPYQLVEPGDLVLNKMKTWQGSIAVSKYRGIVSPAYFTYRPGKHVYGSVLCPKYVHYLVRSPLYIAQYLRLSKGIRVNQWDLDPDTFKTLELVIPPYGEQEAVAAFLDHETTKIDRLIARQARLIELLKEKRQAVISHAVTKGLNPDAPMKDSGVEWLGEVPAHWGTCTLGYLARIDTGSTPDRGNPDYWNGDIPWLKTGEVNYNVITESEEYISEQGMLNSSTRLAPVGTLLMAMYGQGVTRGRVSILGFEATYNQACAAIRVGKSLFNEYAFFYLMAAYTFIRETGNETSQMNLSAEIIGKIKMAIPSADEQQEIVSYLKEKLPAFELLAEKAANSIELAKEHRTALISAAVTGKIDVRGWQRPNTEPQETATAVSA